MSARIIKWTLVAITFLAVLTGCVTFKTFSETARPGDTIALAVGSADNMTVDNTTAVFTDSNGAQHTLTLRSVFRLYADKTSLVYEKGGALAENIVTTSGHEHWLTVVAVDLPETGLAEGVGSVQFTTAAEYPTITPHINDVTMELEILPATAGPGSASEFYYHVAFGLNVKGNLAWLQSEQRVVIQPPFEENVDPWGTNYGAVQVDVDMNGCHNKGAPLVDEDLRVVADDMTVWTQSNRSVISSVNGDVLRVIFISPTGKLQYFEPRFEAVLKTGIDFTCAPSFTVDGISHYDLNGASAPGPIAGANPLTDYRLEVRPALVP